MQRKLIILIICLLSCWMSVFAQQKGTVSGTVKDADSGEALIGVSIYVEKLKMGTTTNEKGYYELSLPVDEQQITVLCQFCFTPLSDFADNASWPFFPPQAKDSRNPRPLCHKADTRHRLETDRFSAH